MKLTDEQREKIIAAVTRLQTVRALPDEEVVKLMVEGEALREELDPGYAARKRK